MHLENFESFTDYQIAGKWVSVFGSPEGAVYQDDTYTPDEDEDGNITCRNCPEGRDVGAVEWYELFNREILVDGNKMQKVFSLEHEVVKKILNLQFNLDKPNEILTQFYKNLDHAIFCTSCGQKLESIYKYLFYLEKREEGLRELQLNFNVAGFTRYDEKEYDNQNQTTIMTDVDDVSIEKFLENLKLVLGPCVGKLSSKKIDINDKYVHGYLYGICDFTNQKYFLSNETDGLSTFMTLHSFVFEPNDPSMLGSIMGTSIKLSEEDDEEFNRGIMDGGSATAKLSKEGNPTFDIYQTLHDYIQENY